MRYLLMTLMTLSTAAALLIPAPVLADEEDRRRSRGEPELTRELVHLEHIHPADAEQVLQPFTSRWGRLDANPSLGTLTIVDEPALVTKMLEVLAEIDVPREEWHFRILLITAHYDPKSRPKAGPLDDLPAVADELMALFSYNVFEELDSAAIKVTDGSRAQLHLGGSEGFNVNLVPHARGDRVSVEFHLYRPKRFVDSGNVTSVHETIVETTFETAPGDTTVVGASRLDGDDRALITILITEPAGS